MTNAAPAASGLLSLHDAALTSAAWPFEEARNLVARVEKTGQKEVLFETGYGPSGLPHIGTSARWRAPPWCATLSRS